MQVSKFASSCTEVSFIVAFCANAVGLERCAGSKRDECVPRDLIVDKRHPTRAMIGDTSIFSFRHQNAVRGVLWPNS